MTSRSSFYGMAFIPEQTPGVDPGIVAATYVDGSSETVSYVPESGGATKYKAFARMAAPPEGLPKYEMKEVPQTFYTNDYDGIHVKGLRYGGETTVTFNIHGTVVDGTTDRPVPPPWLQLAGSGAGVILGHLAADDGGAPDTIASATNAYAFSLTTGTPMEGFPLAHLDGTGLIDGVIRPTSVATNAVVDCGYNSAHMGLAATPTAADDMLYPVFGVFDNRLEDYSQTFTIIFPRPESNSTIMLLGAQAKSWTLTSTADNFPQIKITFIYRSWLNYDAADTTHWPSEPVLDEEPDYYAIWPCSKIVAGGHFWYMKPTDGTVVRDLDITEFEVTWNSGLIRWMANTGDEGVGDIVVGEKQSLGVKFTILYNSEFRSFLSAFCNPAISDTFPITYWEGDHPGHNWFFMTTSSFLKVDPGFDGDNSGLQAQTIELGFRQFTGDDGTNPWDGTSAVDTKFALGCFAN